MGKWEHNVSPCPQIPKSPKHGFLSPIRQNFTQSSNSENNIWNKRKRGKRPRGHKSASYANARKEASGQWGAEPHLARWVQERPICILMRKQACQGELHKRQGDPSSSGRQKEQARDPLRFNHAAEREPTLGVIMYIHYHLHPLLGYN